MNVVYVVIVWWPKDSEDRPPEPIGVTKTAEEARQLAGRHATDTLDIAEPLHWEPVDERFSSRKFVGTFPKREQDSYPAEDVGYDIHVFEL